MRLPPLNALRAFEAAGRHQSFLLAANELHVSAASISRFIKLLEADVGKTLFTRHSNSVNLTKEGEQYLLAIQSSLQHIATVSENFRQQHAKLKLKIISIPAMAETWLVNHLWSFQKKHKDIQIHLIVEDQLAVDDQLVALNPHEATVVLNYSHGIWRGAESFAMPKDKLTLVCNQKIAKTLKKPSDIYQYPFLVDKDWKQDWDAWLGEAEMEQGIPNNHQAFKRYSMVVHATLAGLGVAIGHTSLLASYLDSGVMVAPFDITAQANKQFYAHAAKNTQQASVNAFLGWFLDEEN